MKGESRKTSLLGINECQDSTKFHQYSCLNSCSLIIFKKTTDQHGINASVAGEFKQRATGRYPPPLLNSAGLCSVCILHPRGWLRLLVSTVLTQPGGGDGVGRRDRHSLSISVTAEVPLMSVSIPSLWRITASIKSVKEEGAGPGADPIIMANTEAYLDWWLEADSWSHLLKHHESKQAVAGWS